MVTPATPPPRVMQKLLWPEHLEAILERGVSHLGGPVTDAREAAPLRTPQQLLAAHDLEALSPYGARPDHVDLLRYRVAPMMRHEQPASDGPTRPWPTYRTGFLPTREALVPVWLLHTTRVPAGAEVWRVQGNGEMHHLLTYLGPAVGWRGARGWTPPPTFVGPRAEWEGREWLAAFGAEDPASLELVTYGAAPDPAFVEARPGVRHRMVDTESCRRVFELDLRATWRGSPVRVLHRDGDRVQLELLDDDPDLARSLGAQSWEPGRFEASAPISEIVEGESYSVELAGGEQ